VSVPADLDADILSARKATGKSASELFVRCARKSLPTVVREILREQRREARAFLKRKT
jgi:hypothetical protein